MPIRARTRGNRGRRRRRVLAGCTVAAVLALVGWWVAARHFRPAKPTGEPLLVGMDAVRREYGYLFGKRLENDTATEIESANRLAAAGDTVAAIAALRKVVAKAAVPAVYNNIGVLYARMNDPLNASAAYAAALQREPTYEAARGNLKLLRLGKQTDDPPVIEEIEPNDSAVRANRIRLDTTVTAAIGNPSDLDFYRFTTPSGPRDVMDITVESRAGAFAPVVRVYDGEHRLLLTSTEQSDPRAALHQIVALEPDSAQFVEVFGRNRATGAYTIRVKALRAYDQFEPNDDLAHAVAIQPGAPVKANIMDAGDTDYFQFHSPRTGRVAIVIEDPSATLWPAVTLLGTDMRLLGFGPSVRGGGQGLTYELETVEGNTYYVQVWGRHASAGQYTLVVK